MVYTNKGLISFFETASWKINDEYEVLEEHNHKKKKNKNKN